MALYARKKDVPTIRKNSEKINKSPPPKRKQEETKRDNYRNNLNTDYHEVDTLQYFAAVVLGHHRELAPHIVHTPAYMLYEDEYKLRFPFAFREAMKISNN